MFVRTFNSAVTGIQSLVAVAASLFVASHACLANAYEGFAYPSSLSVSGLAGGVGWAGPWSAGVAASTGFFTLSYPFAKPSTGVAARTNLDANCIRYLHPTTGAIDAVGRQWMSFMYERDATNQMVLEMQGVSINPLYITIYPPGAVSMQYGLGPLGWSTSLSSGAGGTDFLLLHLTPTSADLWVNPVPPLGPPDATVVVPSTVNYRTLIYHMEIVQTLDEIRTGPTLNSVSAMGPPCPGDVSPNPGGDGQVNIDDLVQVITEWGAGQGSPADTNGDGQVNIDDLVQVITGWGNCP